VSFGLFLHGHKYARKHLIIKRYGEVVEDNGGAIPSFDEAENEPVFTSSNEEIVAEVRRILSTHTAPIAKARMRKLEMLSDEEKIRCLLIYLLLSLSDNLATTKSVWASAVQYGGGNKVIKSDFDIIRNVIINELPKTKLWSNQDAIEIINLLITLHIPDKSYSDFKEMSLQEFAETIYNLKLKKR
jgi:hypothetical protein